MTLSLHIGCCTLQGGYREANEDAIAVKQWSDLTLAVVADGMGQGGAVASKAATEIIAAELQCRLPPTAGLEEVRRTIHNGLARANEDITKIGSAHHRASSTVVLAVWRYDGLLQIAHLGDSRAYLIHGEHCEQLTLDHSVANALIAAGTVTPEEALRVSHVLHRYLGAAAPFAADYHTVTIQPGDCFLLCTDGLSSFLTDEMLLNCLRAERDVQKCAEALAQRALDLGSRDNVSCVLLEVAGTPGGETVGAIDVPKRWAASITALARAMAAGEDCAFALYDALEESGHTLLARHFRMAEHRPDCWALRMILGK